MRALRDGPLCGGAAPPPDPRLDSADQCFELVKRLRGEGEIAGAFACQQRLTELLPEDADAWYRLGDLARALGRRQVAREAYERYLELIAEPDAAVDMILTSLRGGKPPARASDRCVVQLFENFAKTYDERMVGRLGFAAPELLFAAIQRARPGLRHARVLDLGSGTGLLGLRLREVAQTLFGVDLSAEMSEKAEARQIYDAIHHEEITTFLSRTDIEPFDLICASDVLIYFGDLRQVLRPAGHRAASGGLCAFTVEATDIAPFRLTDSGRFAHHRSHIEEAAKDAGFVLLSLDDATLRFEYGEPVKGLVAVLQKT